MPANDRPWDKRKRDDDDDRDDDRPRRRRDEEEDRDDNDDRDPPRRRRRDEEDDYEDDRPRPRPKKASNGLAVAGLILGILAPCTAGIAGVPGVICSMLALGKPVGRGLAIAALVVSGLGTLAGIGLAVFIFISVGAARERVKDSNNMKQIGLAFHSFHDSQGQFSAPFVRDTRAPGGVNRDLSFRVALLPYIEQQSVFLQFDMTQAWDSPRNHPHSNVAIATYTSPYSAERASTQTPYRVFYGGGAMFNENGGAVKFADVTDGLSNTILLVHAAEQVPWAQPKELLYNPNGPLPALWTKDMPGTNIVFADGSVRFVSKNVSERTLRAAITRNGGEVVDSW